MRESAARQFVYTASSAQQEAALVSGDITEADLQLRRSQPTGHRRKPSPHPRHSRRSASFTALPLEWSHV
ncbi:hypothetical protein [Glycomyces harbinensis]|nr:hypothetical protein [Glycomyces harbinensis]